MDEKREKAGELVVKEDWGHAAELYREIAEECHQNGSYSQAVKDYNSAISCSMRREDQKFGLLTVDMYFKAMSAAKKSSGVSELKKGLIDFLVPRTEMFRKFRPPERIRDIYLQASNIAGDIKDERINSLLKFVAVLTKDIAKVNFSSGNPEIVNKGKENLTVILGIYSNLKRHLDSKTVLIEFIELSVRLFRLEQASDIISIGIDYIKREKPLKFSQEDFFKDIAQIYSSIGLQFAESFPLLNKEGHGKKCLKLLTTSHQLFKQSKNEHLISQSFYELNLSLLKVGLQDLAFEALDQAFPVAVSAKLPLEKEVLELLLRKGEESLLAREGLAHSRNPGIPFLEKLSFFSQKVGNLEYLTEIAELTQNYAEQCIELNKVKFSSKYYMTSGIHFKFVKKEENVEVIKKRMIEFLESCFQERKIAEVEKFSTDIQPLLTDSEKAPFLFKIGKQMIELNELNKALPLLTASTNAWITLKNYNEAKKVIDSLEETYHNIKEKNLDVAFSYLCCIGELMVYNKEKKRSGQLLATEADLFMQKRKTDNGLDLLEKGLSTLQDLSEFILASHYAKSAASFFFNQRKYPEAKHWISSTIFLKTKAKAVNKIKEFSLEVSKWSCELLSNRHEEDARSYYEVLSNALEKISEQILLGKILVDAAMTCDKIKNYRLQLEYLNWAYQFHKESKNSVEKLVEIAKNKTEYLFTNRKFPLGMDFLSFNREMQYKLEQKESLIEFQKVQIKALILAKQDDHAQNIIQNTSNIFQELGNETKIAEFNIYIAECYREKQKYHQSLDFLNNARKIFLKLQAKSELRDLAKCYQRFSDETVDRRDIDNELFLKEAFLLFEKLDLAVDKGVLLVEEGKKQFEREEFGPAFEKFEEALMIFLQKDKKNAKGTAELLCMKGQELITSKKFEAGKRMFNIAVSTFNQLKDLQNVAIARGSEGFAFIQSQEHETGIDFCLQSAEYYGKVNKHVKAGEVFEKAGNELANQGATKKALELFKLAAKSYRNAREKVKMNELALLVENHAKKLVENQNRRNLKEYSDYFDFAVSLYEEFQFSERLGDLRLYEVRRMIQFKNPLQEILGTAKMSGTNYAKDSSGEKVVSLSETLIEYSHNLLAEKEYLDAQNVVDLGIDLLIQGKQDEIANKILREQALYFISKGVIDPGMSLLDRSADLLEENEQLDELADLYFESALKLTEHLQFPSAIALISRSASLFEETGNEEKIRTIANQCVILAEALTIEGNDIAAKLYFDKSTEIYEEAGIVATSETDRVYTDFSVKLVDRMKGQLNERTSVRRGKKRKEKPGFRRKKTDTRFEFKKVG